jgi:hypothetical protein
MDNQYTQKAKKLEAIYKKYMPRFIELNKKQNQLINEFTKKLEEAKITKIKNDIGLK